MINLLNTKTNKEREFESISRAEQALRVASRFASPIFVLPENSEYKFENGSISKKKKKNVTSGKGSRKANKESGESSLES